MKHTVIVRSAAFLIFLIGTAGIVRANPMPTPMEITEFSTSPGWVEVYGYASSLPYYPLTVNAVAVALNADSVAAMAAGKGAGMYYFVLNQSNTAGFDLPGFGGRIQLMCSIPSESGPSPTSVPIDYGTSGDVLAPAAGQSAYAESVFVSFNSIFVTGWSVTSSPTPGSINTLSTVSSSTMPSAVVLRRNIPNPFNPSTTISFALSSSGKVRLDLYDTLGRKVVTLVDGPMIAGEHAVVWNAAGYASGMYFCRLRTGNTTVTNKMLLMK